jgi:STIP1 homology and U-box containing protein 1
LRCSSSTRPTIPCGPIIYLVDDTIEISTDETNTVKGHHYKALALISLNRADEAIQPSMAAYNLAISLKSRSAQTIGQVVLDARKKSWELKENRRLKQEAALLFEAIEGLRKLADGEKEEVRKNAADGSFGYVLSSEELQAELNSVDQRVERRIEHLRDVFAMSNERHQIRVCFGLTRCRMGLLTTAIGNPGISHG